jgi:serine phosphatase RsbU (regulator of sigma subunit)
VLRQVNELLIPDMPKNMFVTCLYAILEPGSGRITFANAGQCLPFQLSQGEVIELRATGMPLGLLPDMDYEQTEACIAPGDRFFLYSDGLLEAHSPQRELFGLRRLKSLFKLLPQGVDPPVFMLDGLATFTGADWEQEDDVTMLLLERHNS